MEIETAIEEAISALIPKFGITSEQAAAFRKPTVEICKPFLGEASYNWKKAIFKFSPDMLSDILNEWAFIVHEVGHYLHYELNPPIFEKIETENLESLKFWSAMTLSETVAEYAEIICITDRGIPFSYLPKSIQSDSEVPGIIPNRLEAAHNVGYKRAKKAFQEYGSTLLPALARMSIDEAEQKLPRILPISVYERRILPIVDRFRG